MRQVHGMSDDNTTIIVKKFDGNISLIPFETNDPITSLFLDIETTGLDKVKDKIIDLAYIVFIHDKNSRRIVKIKKEFNQLEDPNEPLSDIVKKITKYADEDLKDKKINWDEVESDFNSAGVIISHNAAFDRAFLDRYLKISKDKIWACSINQIDWKDKGHPSKSLECLAMNHGFFFDSHTALSDVKASLHLISMIDPDTSKPYLFELLSNAGIKRKKIAVFHSNYEFGDEFKKRGYRWTKAEKTWSIIVPQSSLLEEEFIKNNQPFSGQLKVELLPLKDNFKI